MYPARTAGFTTVRSIAISGTDVEVDGETLEAYAGEAFEQGKKRRRQAAELIARQWERLAHEAETLQDATAKVKAPPEACNRARRVVHDLNTLAAEMRPSPSDGV
jgi:hypothetical protein